MSDDGTTTPDHSPTLGALAKALAKAQGAMQNAKKENVNPHFKSKYADLASIRDAIQEHFSANDLAVSQMNEPHGKEGVLVVTMLVHGSGEWLRSRLFVPVVKQDPQGFGSALTYARRYALAAIANVATDDDDGNAGAGKPPVKKEEEKPAPAPAASKSVDVAALKKALLDAKTPEEFAKAEANIGKNRSAIGAEDMKMLRELRAELADAMQKEDDSE